MSIKKLACLVAFPLTLSASIQQGQDCFEPKLTKLVPTKRLWSETISSLKKKSVEGPIHKKKRLPSSVFALCEKLNSLQIPPKKKLTITEVNVEDSTIDDKSFALLVNSNTTITRLSTGCCTKLSYTVPFQTQGKLTDINVGYTKIPDHVLKQLLLESESLWKLDLVGCTELTFNNFVFPPKINWLDLSDTKINKKRLKALLEQLSFLVYLGLTRCYELPENLQKEYLSLQEIEKLRDELEK